MNQKGQAIMGSKGQAFSVFELMIAAIVAVAILFVLLPIISGGFSFNTTPKDAISNALSSIETGGNAMTQEFTLDSGDILKSDQFANDGFDAHSIVFAIAGDNKYPAGKGDAAIDDSEDFSYFKYTGNVPIAAKAMVYCAQTGESLVGTLGLIDAAYSEAYNGVDIGSDLDEAEEILDDDEAILTLCGADDYQPCCAVIIMRK